MKEGRQEGKEAHKRWADLPKDEEGAPRVEMATLPPEVSCQCFDEIAKGYTEAEAQAEADPLSQLRRLLRMYAMRGRLSGRGDFPWPTSRTPEAGRGRGHHVPGLPGL